MAYYFFETQCRCSCYHHYDKLLSSTCVTTWTASNNLNAQFPTSLLYQQVALLSQRGHMCFFSCLSVVSFIASIVQYLERIFLLLVTMSSDLPVRTIRFCSVVFGVTSSRVVIHTIHRRPWLCTARDETALGRSRTVHSHGRDWSQLHWLDVKPKTTEQNRIVRTGKTWSRSN